MTATRKEWNKLATNQVSKIVGGDVEVVLMRDTISIYSETKEHADSALNHFQKAGSELVKETYYDTDEDLPEAWTYEVTLGD